MHKENVDVVHKLKKDYRSHLGQGIPDPCYYPSVRQNIPSCKDLKENLRKYLLPLFDKNKNKVYCHCCEKNYLLECPDKSDGKNRNCTCKTCHSKDCTIGDQCNCIEILQTWASKNTHLKERGRREGRKKLIKSRNSLNGCETDDEGSNSSSSATCICPRNFRTNGSLPSSEQSKNFLRRGFLHRGCNESKAFFPYIRGSKHLRLRDIKTASKEIQTEMIGDTKIVQTENGENDIQASSKCFRCNMYQSQQATCRINPLEKTLRVSPNFAQNHAVVYPCGCHDRLFDKHSPEKERKKKEKIRKEGSSGDYQRHFKMEDNIGNASKVSDYYKPPENETLDSLFKINKNVWCQPSLKNFTNLKYLTDSRLKNYLRMRETLRRYNTNLPLNETADQGEETYSSQKLEKFKFLYHKSNEICAETVRKNDLGNQKCDRGVTTEMRESEIITKYFNEMHESDGSRTYGLVRNHKNRKRRKVAYNRRRKLGGRKKLVNKNTQVGRGEVTRNSEKSSGDGRDHRRRIIEGNEKFKQIVDGYKIPERGTLVELFKPTGEGKVSTGTRRGPIVLKFRAGDFLIEKAKD